MGSIDSPCGAYRLAGLSRLLVTGFVLLPVVAGAQTSTDRLGTLFYSPAERAAIVALRRGAQPGATVSDNAVSVTGLVKRGGQKSTAWINGHTVAEGQAVPAAGVPVIEAKRVIIDGQPVRVRETLDLDSGARSDVLSQDAVSVRKQK